MPKPKYLIGQMLVKMSLEKFKTLDPTLPKLLGVDRSTIYRDKIGQKDIPGDRLAKWAKILQVPIESLIDDGHTALPKMDDYEGLNLTG